MARKASVKQEAGWTGRQAWLEGSAGLSRAQGGNQVPGASEMQQRLHVTGSLGTCLILNRHLCSESHGLLPALCELWGLACTYSHTNRPRCDLLNAPSWRPA